MGHRGLNGQFFKARQVGICSSVDVCNPAAPDRHSETDWASIEVDSAMETAESRYKIMSSIKGGSTLNMEKRGHIPVASGFSIDILSTASMGNP